MESPVSLGAPQIAGELFAGRYQLGDHLCTEILGEVYEARDAHSGARVHVKILHPGFHSSAERFRAFGESITASWLVAHPCTLEVRDWGEADGQRYLVTEAFAGRTLWATLDGFGMSWEDAVEVAAHVASALAAAHAEGVLHRALTPTNVLVAELEGERLTKVRDFGMADIEDVDGAAETTTINAGLEELRFLAPEIVAGGKPSRASDLYGLGALLFLMLTGRAPEMRVQGPQRPGQRAYVPDWLDDLCAELTDPDPSRRPRARSTLRRLEDGSGRRLVRPAVPQSTIPTEVTDEPESSASIGAVILGAVGCLVGAAIGLGTIATVVTLLWLL